MTENKLVILASSWHRFVLCFLTEQPLLLIRGALL